MRIISKVKDYYDYVQQYGFDTNVVYDRNTLEINRYGDTLSEFNRITDIINKYDTLKFISYIPKNDYLDYCNLYFCGRIYFFWIYKEPIINKNYQSGNYTTVRRIIWNINELSELYIKHPPRDWKFANEWLGRYLNKFKNAVQIDTNNQCCFINLNYNQFNVFTDINCPVFLDCILDKDLYNCSGYTLNPLLTDISFYHIMDAQTCYQTIDTFLSSIQTKTNTVEISNESKILKHGMDETSFVKTENTSKPRSKKIKKLC